jgi:hypothetical protein
MKNVYPLSNSYREIDRTPEQIGKAKTIPIGYHFINTARKIITSFSIPKVTLLSVLMLGFILLYSEADAQCDAREICADNCIPIDAETGDIPAATMNAISCWSSGVCDDPNFFFFEIAVSGDVELTLASTIPQDVDFIVFGPYADAATAEAACIVAGDPPAVNDQDCGETNGTGNETISFTGAIASEFYLLLICEDDFGANNDDMSISLENVNGNNTPGAIVDCARDDSFNSPLCDSDLDGCTGYFTKALNCPPKTGWEAGSHRGGLFACFPDPVADQSGCPVSETDPGIVDIEVACPLESVEYDRPTPGVSVYVQYWNECVTGVSFPNTGGSGYEPNDQGFINQLFCEVDANGYPKAPSDIDGNPLIPIEGIVPFLPSDGGDVNMNGGIMDSLVSIGTNCSSTTKTELVQSDFWILVPASVPTIGFMLGGGLFDSGLFMVGPSLDELCATSEFTNPGGGPAGAKSGIEEVYYTIPNTAIQICGGKLLRVRFYVTDIEAGWNVDPEINIGNGFEPLADLPGVVAIAATGPDDNTPPTIPLEMDLKGFVDMNNNIFDVDGNFEPYACATLPDDVTPIFPTSVDLGQVCADDGDIVILDIDQAYNFCTGDATFSYSESSPFVSLSGLVMTVTQPVAPGTYMFTIEAEGPLSFPNADRCTFEIDFSFEVTACCEFTTTCPTSNDLGTYDCTNLNTIPACPADSAAAASSPYNITIGTMPCGKIEVICTDDITMYDVCAMGGQTINREVIIYDDLDGNQMLDMGEESDTCTYVFTIDEDTTSPVPPAAPADVNVQCASDVPPPVDLTAVDNCSPDITVSPIPNITPGNCLNDFVMVRIWTFTDTCGNTSAVSQTITVLDDTAPTPPAPPADLNLQCSDDVPPPVDLTAVDNCDGDITVLPTANITPGNCLNDFTMVRTWTFTDTCGNTSAVSQTITVLDDTAPVPPAPPADVNVQCAEDVPPPVDLTAVDNCDGDITVSPTADITPGNCLNDFTMVRTWTFMDTCGNTSSVSQTITVDDITNPTIVCPAPVTVECIEDVPAPDVTLPVVADNCLAPVVVTHEGDVSDGLTCPETITRTYRVTDACGNFAECTQVITVNDITDPTIICPAPVTVACLQDVPPADITLPVTDDNCLAPLVVTHEGDDVNATQCDGGTITRTYRVTDACGNFAECEQTITVLLPPPPVITCPADQTVECIDDFVLDPNTATATSLCGNIVSVYIKNPLISGVPNCDGTVYTYIYVAVDDCGRSSECEQQVLIQNDPATISVPAGGTVTCFEDIDISLDDATVNGACADYNLYLVPPVVDGEFGCPGTTYTYVYRLIDVCGNTVEEPVVFTNGANAGPTIVAPIDITCECLAGVNTNPLNAAVTTACGGDVGYEVTVSGPMVAGTQDCPGTTYTYTYTVTDACGRTAEDQQVFTVDNEGPVVDCPEDCVILNCEDGDYNAIINAWLASVTATGACGGNITVTNDFNGVNGLCIWDGVTPVNFTATDLCGRSSTCVRMIMITDTEAPLIYDQPTEVLVPCNGVTEDIFNAWLANQGGAEALDGCWGSNISWSTIPANPTLDCAGGPQAIIVEFVATDGCGNSSSVTGIFNTKLQPDMVNISGQVFREDAEAVEGVQLGVEGGNPGLPEMEYTGNSGGYGFPEFEYEDSLMLVPEKNDDPLNGISTFDLVLMQKHILLLQTLDSPYKIIAADINHSGTVSTIDVVLLRKLILFIDTEFTQNTSWRFVDADFVFPNPQNPFETTFPEVYMLSGAEEEEADFVGVKIGDLNLSAETNGLMGGIDDRSGLDDLTFEVEDQALKSGEQYHIDFTARNFKQINGFQFTINFDQTALDVIEIQGVDLVSFNDKNYGLSQLDKGAVTVSWNHDSFVDLKSDEVVFSLLVNARSEVQLSEVISITSQYTRAEAYQSNELMNVNLAFNNSGTVTQSDMFRLFQNQPNPFKDETLIGFYLPEASFATLTLMDASGRVLKTIEGDFTQGYNEITLGKSEIGVLDGVIFYRLETRTDTATKKMLLIRN